MSSSSVFDSGAGAGVSASSRFNLLIAFTTRKIVNEMITKLIIVLMNTLGAHLAILQTVAWARMMAAYSRTESLKVTVQKTFDGEHPCAMCLKIRRASNSRSSLSAVNSQVQSDGTLQNVARLSCRREHAESPSASNSFKNDHFVLPDFPPPKDIFS